MIRALISQAKGVAVYDDGQRIGILSARELIGPKARGPRHSESAPIEFHCTAAEATQVLSGAVDLETLMVADLTALRTHLQIRIAQQEALNATLLMIDPTQPPNVRHLAAELLWSPSLQMQRRWVEGVLLAAPLPEAARIDDLEQFKPPHLDVLKALAARQKQVSLLRRCWLSLPQAVFIEEDRQRVLAGAVRAGVFHSLLLGGFEEAVTGPFKPTLGAFRVSLDQVARESSLEPTFLRQKLVRVPDFDKSAPPWLWDIAPWRIGGAASHWPETELRFACQKFFRLVQPHSADMLRKRPSGELQKMAVQRFASEWSLTCSRSSGWLLMLDGLDRTHLPSESTLDHDRSVAFPLSVGAQQYFAAFTHTYELSSTRSSIASFFANFFGLNVMAGGSSLLRALRSLILGPPDELAVARLADQTQHRAGVRVMFEVKNIQAAHHFDQPVTTSNDTSQDIERFIRILGTYGALRRLQRKGCFVLTRDRRNLEKAKVRADIAWLLNPERRLNIALKGHCAELFELLVERLWADVSSGLRTDHCGWQLVTEANATSGEASEASVRETKETIKQGGLTEEMIEVRDGDVRLNPDLVVILPSESS